MPALRHNTRGRKYMQTSVSTSKVQCQYCNESYASRGIKSHEQSCLRRKEKKKEDKKFVRAAVHSMLNEGEHIDSSSSSHIVLIISWINHWSSIFYVSDRHHNKRHKNINEHNPTSTSAQVSVLADSDSGGATATSVVAASIDGYDYDDGHDYPTAGLEGGLDDTQSVKGEARQCMCSYLNLISHKTNIVYQVLTLIQAWPAPLQEQHLLRLSFQFLQPQQRLQPIPTHSRRSSTPTVVTLQLSRHFLLMGVDRKHIHPLLMIHLGTLLPVMQTLSSLSSCWPAPNWSGAWLTNTLLRVLT
jgi:hypothetical protein